MIVPSQFSLALEVRSFWIPYADSLVIGTCCDQASRYVPRYRPVTIADQSRVEQRR
jgi:hypothetical protein